MLKILTRRLPLFEPSVDRLSRSRIFALDGLRGWAALSVVCFHLLWETFGEVDPLVRNAFTAFLLDGSLAVSLFFVLSGEALSSSYFAGGGRRAVVDLAIKRYPRLVIPVLATSIITAILVHFGANYNAAAGEIVGRSDWLGSWVGFAPSLLGTFRFALFGVFTSATLVSPTEALVPFLWTMRIELMGSVLVFALLLLSHGRRYGWHMTLAVFAVLMAGYVIGRPSIAGNLACFVAGLVFAKLRFDGFFDRAKAQPWTFYVSSGAIVVLLAIDSVMHSKGFYDARCPLFAMLFVAFVSCNNLAEHFLSSAVSQFLGRISFPIFLIQFPVIISLTSWLIVRAGVHAEYSRISLWIFLCSLMTCVIAALLFEPVEHFTKAFCRRLSQHVLAKYPHRSVRVG
jgi:peptidoglycan/LPS O-acetylase OafA/YrhL